MGAGNIFSSALPIQERKGSLEKGQDRELVTEPEQKPGPGPPNTSPNTPRSLPVSVPSPHCQEKTPSREALAGTEQILLQGEGQEGVRLCNCGIGCVNGLEKRKRKKPFVHTCVGC